jgi:O-acetyl-ADP-ribose deacetylase
MASEEYSKKVKNTLVRVKIGDIAQEEADGIVNPANSLLIMGGGVAGAIREAGGEGIETEAIRQAPCPVGQAVSTSAGALKARFVIHAPTMSQPGMKINAAPAKRATEAALDLARKLQLKSLSVPGMGTGVGGVSYKDAGRVMMEALRNHIYSGTTLALINLVARDRLLFDTFKENLAKL